MKITKQCRSCNQVKESSEFRANLKLRDGLHSYCKACERLHSYASKKRHPEVQPAIYKRWVENNRERRIELNRQWQQRKKQEGKCIRCAKPKEPNRMELCLCLYCSLRANTATTKWKMRTCK